MARALQSDGRAKRTGQTAATTKCPGCCGPGGSCCFCVNIDETDPSKPCYPKGYVPPLLCNPIRSCCCGSRVRIVGKVSVVQRTDTFDINTQWQTYWETNKWELTAVTLWHIEREQDGSCKTVYDGLESLTTTRHREYQFGAGTVHIEDTNPNPGFEPGSELRPEIACRPEPYHVWFRMLTFGDGVLPGAEDNILAPFLEKCADTVNRNEHIPPDENGGFEDTQDWQYTWGAQAECKSASIDVGGSYARKIVYHPAFGSPYSTYEETRTGTRTASIQTVTVEDDCCPDKHGDPYNPAPDPTPGIPGLLYLGGNRYRWLGMAWIGIPMPLRWLYGIKNAPGCGCHAAAKGWWDRAKEWWR